MKNNNVHNEFFSSCWKAIKSINQEIWQVGKLRIPAMLLFCIFSINLANAAITQWDSDDINGIINDVKDVKARVKGNVGNTPMSRFKIQLQAWEQLHSNSRMLTEVVKDILDWLPGRLAEYQSFVGGSLQQDEKCSGASPCAILRDDLHSFFYEFSELAPKLPVITQYGLDDYAESAYILDTAPPVALFFLDHILRRTKDWQSIPSQLSTIYDEIDDPDAFADIGSLLAPASTQDSDPEPVLDPRLLAVEEGLPIRTLSQRFCRIRALRVEGFGERVLDPIRLNRIRLAVIALQQILDAAIEAYPDDVNGNGTVVGEGGGTALPTIDRISLVAVRAIINTIVAAVDTHRSNLDICRARIAQVEDRLAGDSMYFEFLDDATVRREYYRLVFRRLKRASFQGLNFADSGQLFERSIALSYQGNYNRAFHLLAKAYQKIGTGKPCTRKARSLCTWDWWVGR